MMQSLCSGTIYKAHAHQEAVEEDGGSGQSELRQLKHDADLSDEIDSFTAQLFLPLGRHTVLS